MKTYPTVGRKLSALSTFTIEFYADEYVFMGSRIIAEVVAELLGTEGMRNATQILLAGSR